MGKIHELMNAAEDRIYEKERNAPKGVNLHNMAVDIGIGYERVRRRAVLIEMLRPFVLKLFNKKRPPFRKYKIVNSKLYTNGERQSFNVSKEPPVSFEALAAKLSSNPGTYHEDGCISWDLWHILVAHDGYRSRLLLTASHERAEIWLKILVRKRIIKGNLITDFYEILDLW